MKINCDYCGAQIDTDKYDTCPNCGGGFDRDRELLKEKEKLNKVDELYIEKQQLENERMRIENEKLRQNNGGSNGLKAVKYGCGIPLVILGIVFVIIMIFVFTEPDSGSGQTVTEAAQTAPRITGTFTVSLDPISIPEIPEIPEIPKISIDPEIPDIDINTLTAE